ncbi:uncharacterized protein LOC136037040 isoform X1 [Artemia franciscana]
MMLIKVLFLKALVTIATSLQAVPVVPQARAVQRVQWQQTPLQYGQQGQQQLILPQQTQRVVNLQSQPLPQGQVFQQDVIQSQGQAISLQQEQPQGHAQGHSSLNSYYMPKFPVSAVYYKSTQASVDNKQFTPGATIPPSVAEPTTELYDQTTIRGLLQRRQGHSVDISSVLPQEEITEVVFEDVQLRDFSQEQEFPLETPEKTTTVEITSEAVTTAPFIIIETTPSQLEDIDIREISPETGEEELEEEAQPFLLENAAPALLPQEIFVAETTENTTLISPEVAQYHSEKDSHYNFAQNDVFPQSVMDMVATGGDSGFDHVGKISYFSYFRNDNTIDHTRPFRGPEKARSLVLDQFNRFMADHHATSFDWDQPESFQRPSPVGSQLISSQGLPAPKQGYGVPKAHPLKYSVPKTSYGVPQGMPVGAPIADTKNMPTLSDIITPKQYFLEQNSQPTLQFR